MNDTDSSNLEFSLTRGGPLFAILRATRLVGPAPQALRSGLTFAAATWVPMAVLAGVHRLSTSTVDPVLRDPAVHVRLLVAIPLFFLAEALLEERCASCYRRIVDGYVHRKAAAAPIAKRAARLRDSWLAEAVMLAIGIAFGQSALWGITGGSGVLRGVAMSPSLSASLVWYTVVGLPIFQFFLLRSLYRWAIWSWMLVSLSRIELDLVPTHPDLAGGIEAVSEPVESFAAIVAAGSAVISATWSYRIVEQNVDPQAFASPFVVLVAFWMLLAFGPLLCFSVRLWRARIVGLRQYSALARRYTRLFHERWIIEPNDASLLGSQDICGLTDLATAFEKLGSMRFVPFGPRLPIVVLVAAFAPMLPIVAMKQPIPDLILGLGRAVVGGLPP